MVYLLQEYGVNVSTIGDNDGVAKDGMELVVEDSMKGTSIYCSLKG